MADSQHRAGPTEEQTLASYSFIRANLKGKEPDFLQRSGAIISRMLALFSGALLALWLSMNRPGNGQDLPLSINFAHLPDFEARMVNLVVDDKVIVKRHQP